MSRELKKNLTKNQKLRLHSAESLNSTAAVCATASMLSRTLDGEDDLSFDET